MKMEGKQFLHVNIMIKQTGDGSNHGDGAATETSGMTESVVSKNVTSVCVITLTAGWQRQKVHTAGSTCALL